LIILIILGEEYKLEERMSERRHFLILQPQLVKERKVINNL
jgi:hypothetical protein